MVCEQDDSRGRTVKDEYCGLIRRLRGDGSVYRGKALEGPPLRAGKLDLKPKCLRSITESMIRAVTLGALVLLISIADAFAWPTDDLAWKICKTWALGQVKASPPPAFSDISMQNSKDNYTAVFFAVDSQDSSGAMTREYGRCITNGVAIKDFSELGGDTEPILKAWVLEKNDARRRPYNPPPN